MPNEPNDEELMKRVSAGDLNAFDALFLRHQRGAYNYLLRFLGDAALAEDLTQECFLRVWRAREGYQATAAFRTWLFAIARRLALDELKRCEPETISLGQDGEERLSLSADRSTNPLDLFLAKEMERTLEGALNRLSPELREAVILRDMEGFRYEEIARITGCPVGTVRSRLHAARERLREAARRWRGSD